MGIQLPVWQNSPGLMEQYLSVIAIFDQEGPSWPGRRVSPPRFSHFQDMAGHTTVSAQNVPGHKDSFSVCTFQSTEAPLFPGQMFPVRTFCVLGGWPVKAAWLDKPFSQFFIPGYE